MTDLTEARALAETARDDTSDGLLAREKLADVVDALLGMLGDPQTEWAAQSSVIREGKRQLVKGCDDEQDARAFIADLPQNARGYWRVVRRAVYRHEGQWEPAHE